MMDKILIAIFLSILLIGSFYLGYLFSIDIFELLCFRTQL
jgi:hypothetical protein